MYYFKSELFFKSLFYNGIMTFVDPKTEILVLTVNYLLEGISHTQTMSYNCLFLRSGRGHQRGSRKPQHLFEGPRLP